MGVMKCSPAYSVPGSVPLIWLIRTPPIPLSTTTMLAAISIGKQAAITKPTLPRQAISAGSGFRPPPPALSSIPHRRAARYRFHIPYIGIPSAAASISTPAIVSSIFSASIFDLLLCSSAPLVARLPAAERLSAGPVRQTSALREPAVLLAAAAPPPTRSWPQPANSWRAYLSSAAAIVEAAAAASVFVGVTAVA